MIEITGNIIDVGFPQDQKMDHPKPHLVLKDHPKPKCAFIIGDGFTQGYLRNYNLQGDIPCTINDLIPAPDCIPYIPMEGDKFKDSKFFTKEKWPKTYDAYSKGLKGLDFFKEISKEKINPVYKDRLWSLSSNSIGYELRCYLWYYFSSANVRLLRLMQGQPLSKNYGWYFILRTILENYYLQIISFNYDFVVQRVITEATGVYPEGHINKRVMGWFQYPVEMSYDYYMNFYDINTIPICYIHGSWVNQIHFPWLTGDNWPVSLVSNPWLENQIKFDNNYFSTVSSEFVPYPKIFPMFPDIIPPGFQGHDKYNPYSQATDTSRRILNEADLVIICGLSGAEPDTEEVKDLLGSISKEIDVLHIGLSGDQENPVAKTLKNNTRIKWLFFDALNELLKVDEYLKDKFKLI